MKKVLIVFGTRPEAIINFATESHVDRSIDNPNAFIETNILGTFELLNCTLKYYKGLDGNIKKQFRFLHKKWDTPNKPL